MTISTTSRVAGPFAGNGVQTVFAFAFKVFSTSDLSVVKASSLGAETTLTLGADYSASLNADQDTSPGGTITKASALAVGETLVITSNVAPLQSVKVTNAGGFFPNVFNGVFDKLTILVQQLQNKSDRSLRFPITDDATGYGDLPTLVSRKGAVLQFNPTTGKPEAGPTSAGIAAAVSAAAGSAANAATSEANALTYANSAAASLDSFDDRYLGSKATPPTLDNDGNALQVGALYWNDGTVVPANKGMWVYDGAAWNAAYTDSSKYLALAGGTMTGALNFAPQATVASAATTNIGAATANTVNITGTTTITSLGTAASGVERELIFAAALTLTHNGTSLILPGGANIVTAAGDTATAVSAGSGNWRITKYQKANGAAVSAATASLKRSVKTGNYTVLTSDVSTVIELNSASAFTLSLTAAATMGDGAFFWYINKGTGIWTIDPNSTELIDGVQTFSILPGEARLVQCDGTAWKSIIINPFFHTYTANGTFPILAPGYTAISGMAWGGGGGGAAGTGSGFGGNGGGCTPFMVPKARLASPVSITVAASVLGSSNASLVQGNNSSFGSFATAFGGSNSNSTTASSRGYTTSVAVVLDVYAGQNCGGAVALPLNPAVFGGAAGASSFATTQQISAYGGDGGAYTAAANGGAGAAPGGGGAGSDTGFTGGAGARGELRVWGIAGN